MKRYPKIYSILPKILHNTNINCINSVKTEIKTDRFFTFYDNRMDFYFRKMLKHNKVSYSYDRKRKCLTINEADSTFRFFMIFEDDSNYVIIRKIPCNDFEYIIYSVSIEDLLNKMVRYKIIYSRDLKKLIVPIALKAEQLELV